MMWEPPPVRSERSASDDREEDDPRILLFMREGRDRELLVDSLGQRYDVETTTDVETLDTDFDCCVFGTREFNRVAGTVQSKRDTDRAVFLPFVLLLGEVDADAATVDVREYVDDVIELPVEKAVLFSRIGNLVDRRRTAKRLAEREAQLRRTVEDLRLKEQAMDEAPIGITITDVGGGGGGDAGDGSAEDETDEAAGNRDNLLIYANEEFEALTGYGPEILGSDCRFLQGEHTDEKPRAEIRAALDAEEPVSVDILNYRKNGRTFWNKLDIAPVYDDDGRVTNYVGFQTDITERKIREQRLGVLNRVLSHNLRNAMSVIQGHAALIRDAEGDDQPRTSLAEIEATSEELIGLANTVGEIERTVRAAGSTDIAIDLAGRLDGLLSATRDRYPEASITLTLPEESPEIAVSGVVTAIEEAVDNAIKHNDAPEPSVEIRVRRRSPGWIDVEIEDDGPGIPDQEVSALREGESSLNHAERLGLWLIYWVVNAAGGHLDISGADTGGTVLTLSVPAAE